jgi:hypothetical protein
MSLFDSLPPCRKRFRAVVQDCGTYYRCHGDERGYGYCYRKSCVYCAANFVGDETVVDDASALEFAKAHYKKEHEDAQS